MGCHLIHSAENPVSPPLRCSCALQCNAAACAVPVLACMLACPWLAYSFCLPAGLLGCLWNQRGACHSPPYTCRCLSTLPLGLLQPRWLAGHAASLALGLLLEGCTAAACLQAPAVRPLAMLLSSAALVLQAAGEQQQACKCVCTNSCTCHICTLQHVQLDRMPAQHQS